MDSERERSKKLNIDDPIHPRIELTHEAYNTAIKMLISAISEGTNKVAAVIATHNENSILEGVSLIKQRNFKMNDGRIYFAQLYGM
jgi:proline dehydrogenase